MPPRETLGHNRLPRDHNPNQGLNPNNVRDQDPAADVVDIARSWRRSFYAAGYDDSYVDNSLKPNGLDGGYQLTLLIDEIRKEKRPLSKPEDRFVDYMQSEAKLNRAIGRIDVQKLREDYKGEKADAAMLLRVKEIRDSLQDSHNDPSLSVGDKKRYNEDLIALDFFLRNEGQVPGEPCAQEFFEEIVVDDKKLPDSANADLKTKLQYQQSNIETMFRAWRVIADNGYLLQKSKRRDYKKYRTDRALNYVAVPADEKKQSVPEKPNLKQEPEPESDKENEQNPESSSNPANTEKADDSNDKIKAKPVVDVIDANEALLTKRRKLALAQTVKMLDGSNESSVGMPKIEGVRNELAREKSKLFQNWMSKKKIGRTALSLFGIDAARRDQNIHSLEEQFIRLTHKKFGLNNYTDIKSGLLSGDEEAEAAAISVEQEMNALREKTSDYMRSSLVAKFCKAIGTFEWNSNKKKAAWILGGAGVATASFVTGGMFPAMLAASAVTASRVDKKIRGLPSATKRMSSVELREEIKAGFENEIDKARTKLRQDKAAGRELKKIGVYQYRIGLRAAMRRYDKDMNWEVAKRFGVLGGMGAAAMVGSGLADTAIGYSGSNPATSWMHDVWTEFAGPTAKPTVFYVR